MRAVICLLLLCHHARLSLMRPSEDLDTSIFSLDYEYDSEPYLPNSMGLKEAKMIDPWTLDFRRKLASRDAIDTFAGKSAPPQAQARMFANDDDHDDQETQETTSPVQNLQPITAKLVDNSIPTLVTEVPAIEVPTKFEDLLDDPQIVFKSVSGNENRVNAKVIRRLKDKKTAMDRAREMLRNRLKGVSPPPSSTTKSPFITVTDARGNRPKPFERLRSGTTTTTISSLILASTTVPPNAQAGTTQSMRDQMVAARNRLRALMGQTPIGVTTTPLHSSTPTTPTPSTPTKMDRTRQKIIEDLRLAQEAREAQEALNSTQLDPINANLALPPDPQITVTAKSTIGEETHPSTPPTTSKPTVKEILDATTLKSLDNVLDVPTRMQDTLLRLMQQKGLRQDPLTRLVTTAVTLLDEDEIENLSPPPEVVSQRNPESIVSPPKSNLHKQLMANNDGIFEDLSTPKPHQSNLLRQLQANDDGVVEGLAPPSNRQNYLLGQLQRNHNEQLDLEAPSFKQNPLLRPLQANRNEQIRGLKSPSQRQNPLLRPLRPNHTGQSEGLELPVNPLATKVNSLNRFNPDGLSVPSRRQNPLLRLLRFDKRERILSKGLTPPRFRQNPLFRQLMVTPQKYRDDFLQLPPRQQGRLLAILKRHGGDNFDANALLTVPALNNDELDVVAMPPLEEEEEYVDDYDEPEFEVFQADNPVEEVTFQRASEPLTVDDKKEDLQQPLLDALPSTIVPVFIETTSTPATTTPQELVELLHDEDDERTDVLATVESLHEHDQEDNLETTGVPLETLELTTEFGTLNFEDVAEEEFEVPAKADENTFRKEMKKVIDIMKIAGDDLPVSTIKTLMTDLVAKEENTTQETAEVTSLVNLFKATNAQRAQDNFIERKPNVKPVKDKIEEIVENIAGGPDFSQVLVQKAQQRPAVVKDFKDGLELPHKPRPDFSQVLLQKANQKPSVIKDFKELLEAPRRQKPRLHLKEEETDVATQLPPPPDVQEEPENFSQILIEKSKLKPEILKDFDSGLELPNEEFPPIKEDFGEVPENSVNFTQLLSVPATKEVIEDHIMDMIIENPERAAADLAELFDLNNENEKEDTEEELFQMMEEDPLAVTSAFTDLIMSQKEEIGKPIESPSLKPVLIEDVPKEVQGKMERMKIKPTTDFQTEVFVKEDIPSDLLRDMMALIEEGQLSHKTVIEELINSGVLPVEVTDIGRIPVVVGGKSQPLVRPFGRRQEPVNLARLQQLRVNEPKMIMKDDHHIMKEVGLEDPDGDFEMVKLSPPLKGKLSLPEPTRTPEEKDIEILSSMMDLYDQGLISDEELEQMVVMMENEGVLDVNLEELGIQTPPEVQREVFSAGPFFREAAFEAPRSTDKGKAVSYSHFIMDVPKPPELSPPSGESLHKTPFFDDLSKFDEKFVPHSEGVKPGPAPPYYMSARLPAPPRFRTEGFRHDDEGDQDDFKLMPNVQPFNFETFDKEETPKEFAPPPALELKRHVHQPLPLILHSHRGNGYEHPHFDIPASLINPKAYMKEQSSRQFLPRKGRLNYDVFQTTVRSKRKDPSSVPLYNPPITGFSQVDRKMDEIRALYIDGDRFF